MGKSRFFCYVLISFWWILVSSYHKVFKKCDIKVVNRVRLFAANEFVCDEWIQYAVSSCGESCMCMFCWLLIIIFHLLLLYSFIHNFFPVFILRLFTSDFDSTISEKVLLKSKFFCFFFLFIWFDFVSFSFLR